jgi:hypothetical protein
MLLVDRVFLHFFGCPRSSKRTIKSKNIGTEGWLKW